ncbi:MAG: PQQ-dependent sugar dehydrogenase, partial [Actinomycetota bacterium]|nr:PQQ-dependent sugar dehydrogenase [Actinomycetota bacterium]
MRRTLVAGFVAAALSVSAAPAHAFDLVEIAGTYNAPIHLAGPPGDPTRLMIVQQDGTIRLLKNETTPTTMYLDISAKVTSPADGGGGEEGLFSMAFASPQRFYVAYTAGAGADSDLVVEAYDVAPDGDSADPGSADEIIRIPHPVGTNHNGGQLQIGPDGNLWISTGDGGGVGGDADGDAQDANRLLGKLLRITPGPDGDYTVPPGNPYADGGGAPEVWATGLRNPWRFSFDRATGDLLLGDVGEGTQEEVDRAAAPGLGCGSNFGWPWFEGNHVLGAGSPPPSHHAPLLVHTHGAPNGDTDGDWGALTGGYVIRDTALGADVGKYVYVDVFIGELWLADPVTGATTRSDETRQGIGSFGEDGVGRVYALSLFTDRVYRLVHEDTGASQGAPAPAAVTPTCDETDGMGGTPP